MAHGSRARNVAKEEMCPWGCLSECTNADARGWRVAAEVLEHGASGWVGDRTVEARVKPTGGGLVLRGDKVGAAACGIAALLATCGRRLAAAARG